MRVLLITSSFPPIVGGVETFGFELAGAMSRVARVDVVAPLAADPLVDGPDVYPFSVSRYERGGKSERNPFVAWDRMSAEVDRAAGEGADGAVSARLRAHAILNRAMITHAAVQAQGLPTDAEPDLVVALSAVPSALLAAAISERCHIPYVVCTHGAELLVWKRRPHQRALLSRLLRGAMCVTSVSAFTERLGLALGVEAERTFRLSPAVDVSPYAHLSRDESRAGLGLDGRAKVVLTHGRIDPRKGHDIVIRALPSVIDVHPDVIYVITGDGPTRTEHAKLATELGVSDHVRFEGRVDQEHIPMWMTAADVFVMPSRQIDWNVEGFGIVALEAAAAGVPVIAGNSGGIPDAVVDGTTGYLIDPESPAACAERLIELLGDPALAARMGEQGRARVQSGFDRDHFQRRVSDLVDVAMGAPR